MSDGDLTQFNRVAANAETAVTANALTSALLLPTDGKKITADNNAAGKAPVNRSLKRIGEWLAGLQGSIWGNVTGVTRRTLHSLMVDGTGGNSNTALGGQVVASDDIIATLGRMLIESVSGYLRVGGAAAQRGYYTNAGLHFMDTAAAGNEDANPPGDGPQQNRLCAKNICKAWISLSTDGAGDFTIHDRFNVEEIEITSSPNQVIVTFAGDFADTNYAVGVSGSDSSDTYSALSYSYVHGDKAVGSFPLRLKNDPVAEAMHIDLTFHGKQDT